MKEFRDELLEELLAKSGEFIDIEHLLIKYCGEDRTFEPNDQTLIKCRLKMNLVLAELKKMEWILLDPQWGFSSSHKLDQYSNRRYYTLEMPVRVRLTTHGEIEYKKSKQSSQPQTYHDNSIHVGRDITGIANTGTVHNDIINNAEDTEAKSINKKSLTVKKWVLILTAVGIIVAIVLYLLSQAQKA